MSNVFISFLGKGDYKECKYVFKEKDKTTKFIQLALIELFCKHFTEEDSLIFFLTEDARTENWENKLKDGLMEIGLKEEILSLNLSAKIKTVNIPVGKSESEIWEIFNIMYNVLNNNDSVIFDITHAFRSIPMLGFIILYYAGFIKDVKIKNIFYGAYEARNIETNTAPIFRLTKFYKLIQWASAADAFVNYGTSDKLTAMVQETEQFYEGTRDTAKAITDVTESMSLLRGGAIVEGAIFNNCRKKIDELEATGKFQTAFKPIFKKVKEKLSDFKDNDPMNFLYAVKWYLNHKMIPQALTMMQEGLLTFLMKQKKIVYHDKKNRELVNHFIQHLAIEKKQNKRIPIEKEYVKQFNKWGFDLRDKLTVKASIIYNEISTLRNDVNHGGFNLGASNYINISRKIKKLFKEIEELCLEFTAC